MADRSAIEWTDASWNPIRARNTKTGKVGWHCEHATTGCAGCYAEGFNKRLGTGLPFKPGHLRNGDIELFLDEEALTQPLRWKKPRMIFVCSMTDLFARFVPDEWIDRIFAVMALCPQHTFQVLTKRAERMAEYMRHPERKRLMAARVMCISELLARQGGHEARIKLDHFAARFAGSGPFPNVWLGVSAELQEQANERIPLLLATPAAVHIVSIEPLLGPIRLDRIGENVDTFRDCGGHPDPHWPLDAQDATWLNALRGHMEAEARDPAGKRLGDIDVGLVHQGGKLDWVIAGGESGPQARPMHPDWARSLRDQCAAAGVPFFFKQWGAWAPIPLNRRIERSRLYFNGRGFPFQQIENFALVRFGKKGAGRKLDGIEHNAMPRTAT